MAISPEWWPLRLVDGGQSIEFVKASRAQVSNSGFLDHRMARDQATARKVDVSAFTNESISASGPAASYLFHSAFCGSTLLARILDQSGQVLSLKEPHILAQLAQAKRARGLGARDRLSDDGLGAALDRLAGLIERSWMPGEAILIKPTNLANNLIPDLVARGGKAMFLYGPLESFLRSMIAYGEEGRVFMRSLAQAMIRDGELRFDQQTELTDFQIGALAWRAQLDLFRYWLERLGPTRAMSLNFADFSAEPQRGARAVAEFFWPECPGRAPPPGEVDRKRGLDSKSGMVRASAREAARYNREQDLLNEVLVWLSTRDENDEFDEALPYALNLGGRSRGDDRG